MFGLGLMELMIALVIILLVFGAKRIPEVAASFGKGIREFKRSVSDVDQQIRHPEAEKPVDRLRAGGSSTTSPVTQDDVTPSEPKRLI